jgi:hypothetical protein
METNNTILQRHFTKEFGHDGHGEFMPYILKSMEEYSIRKMIDENLSMLKMAELHMDGRTCIVLSNRISELERSLSEYGC